MRGNCTILGIIIFVIGLFIMAHGGNRSLTQILTEADSHFKARQFDLAIKTYQDLLAQAKVISDTSFQIEALSQLARCHLTQNQKEEAKNWLAQAEKIASPSFPSGWARYLGVRGRWEWRNDDLKRATVTFKSMFSFCDEHGLADRANDAILMIGITGSDEERVEWSLKGIEVAEKSGSPSSLGPLWNNLAVTYSELNDYEKTYDAFVKAREYHWQYGSETNKLYADYQIGWALRMKGDNDLALTWLRPSLAWAERLENYDVMGQASQDIGEIMIAKGADGAGLEYLRRAEEYFRKAGYEQNAPDALAKLTARIAELSR
jgi:tetratricopeptide (TPR) repeat protein